jgi:hypothetical protein
MYYPATLILRSYKPLSVERGMLFFNDTHLREITDLPFNEEEYIKENGYPLEPFIVDPINSAILAQPHQVAWIDEGEYYRDIRTDDIRRIIENEVSCYILIEDEGMEVKVIVDEGKVCLLLEEDD